MATAMGAYKGTAAANADLVSTVFLPAELAKDTYVPRTSLNIYKIGIEAPAGSVFTINDDTAVTMPATGIWQTITNAIVITSLKFSANTEVNITYYYR